MTQKTTRHGWTIKSSKTVHHTRWMTIREYESVAPTGVDATYTIMRPNQLAIGIVPIHDDGMITIVGQSRFTTGKFSWELPEGGGSLNGDPLADAQRELAEETRLRAASWLNFLEADMSNSITDERAIGYLCWNLTPDDSKHALDPVEDIVIRRIGFKSLLEKCENREITDVFTLMIMFKLAYLVHEKKLPNDLLRKLC